MDGVHAGPQAGQEAVSPLLWSVLLTTMGVTGLYLAGRDNSWGWAIGFVAQGFWIVYSIQTEQYGFIVFALCAAAVYGRNWVVWRRSGR